MFDQQNEHVAQRPGRCQRSQPPVHTRTERPNRSVRHRFIYLSNGYCFYQRLCLSVCLSAQKKLKTTHQKLL